MTLCFSSGVELVGESLVLAAVAAVRVAGLEEHNPVSHCNGPSGYPLLH